MFKRCVRFILFTSTFVLMMNALARAEDPVAVAQRALLAGRFQEAVIAAKDAILSRPGDDAVATAMASLAETAFRQAGEAGIHPDWNLPEGVLSILTAYKRTTWEDGGGTGAFWFLVFARDADAVRGIKVMRSSGEVLIDSSLGSAQAGNEKRTDGHLNWGVADLGSGAPRVGLYEFEILLRGREKPFQGWFLWTDPPFDGAAIITEPARANAILPARPAIAWEGYSFPNESPDEQRYVHVNVASCNEACQDVSVFDYYQRDAAGAFQIGDTADFGTFDPKTTDYLPVYARVAKGEILASGADSLPDGRYVLNVKVGRSRRFGPMFVNHFAIRSRAFMVGTKPLAPLECGGQ